MEKLRKFKTEEEFLNIKNSLKYPQVSLTDDNGKVWVKEKPISYIIAKYYISEEDVNKPTLLWGGYSSLQYADYYIIDGEQIDNKNSSLMDYTFNSIGEHTVEVYFKGYVDSLSCGFVFAENLISVDLSNFDTSKVTSMGQMFQGCINLKSVTFGDNFNTSNVINMYNMFYDCNGLTSLDLSNFNTSNVTTMSFMFYYCTNLTLLDLSSFDTSNVTDMSSMFDNCRNLTSLDLNGWDISKVEYGPCAFNSVNNDVVIGVDPTLDIFMCGE